MSSSSSILDIPAPDDDGARTADLYQWQASMAAADGLAMLARCLRDDLTLPPGMAGSVICEHHEDWIVRLDDQAEIVSAKHREPHLGPWESITVLVSKGGVGHLFARWILLKREVAARLVSCAGLANGEAKDLGKCPEFLRRLADGETLSDTETATLKDCVDRLARALMMYRKELPSDWQAPSGSKAKQLTPPPGLIEAVRAFLKVLAFDTIRPNREFAPHAAPTLYAAPLIEKFGQPASIASVIWGAVVALFEIRMRGRGPASLSGLPQIGVGQASQATNELALETKTVALADILVSVRTAIANPGAYMPLARPARVSTLSMKMANGGCSENSITRAERLRLDYSQYRRTRESSVPGSRAERAAIERALLRVADEETTKVRTASGRWGTTLWSSLSDRLDDHVLLPTDPNLDGELALGCICDLTARCQVWFSSGFDVAAAVAAEKSSRGA